MDEAKWEEIPPEVREGIREIVQELVDTINELADLDNTQVQTRLQKLEKDNPLQHMNVLATMAEFGHVFGAIERILDCSVRLKIVTFTQEEKDAAVIEDLIEEVNGK